MHLGGGGGLGTPLLVLLLLKKIRKLDCFVRKVGSFHVGISNFTLWHVQTVLYKRSGIKKKKLGDFCNLSDFSVLCKGKHIKQLKIQLKGRGGGEATLSLCPRTE